MHGETFRFCPQCGAAMETRPVDGQERNACGADGCGFVHWNNPVPVVAAIVEHNGEIVLANNQSWPAEIFGLITGFLERSETPEAGTLREVKEELGLIGEIVSLVGVYPFSRMNQVIIAYHVQATGTIRLGAELRASKHIAKNRLQPWDFGTGLAVRDWLRQLHGDTP